MQKWTRSRGNLNLRWRGATDSLCMDPIWDAQILPWVTYVRSDILWKTRNSQLGWCKERRELLIHIKIYTNVKWSAEKKKCLSHSYASMSWYKEVNYITLPAERRIDLVSEVANLKSGLTKLQHLGTNHKNFLLKSGPSYDKLYYRRVWSQKFGWLPEITKLEIISERLGLKEVVRNDLLKKTHQHLFSTDQVCK